jgi:Uma2 family endonuclease
MEQEVEYKLGQPMTLEEWYDMPEDEDGEIVDGLLVEEEVPSYAHEVIVGWLAQHLRAWLVPRGGFVGGSGAKFAVGILRGRKPDLSAYFPGRKPPPYGLVRTPPDIAVEIVTATPRDRRRDRVAKLHEYAAFGIRYYWILDPEMRTLEIFERTESGHFMDVLGATEGRVENVPGCDGLTLDLDGLWAEIERLDPESAG